MGLAVVALKLLSVALNTTGLPLRGSYSLRTGALAGRRRCRRDFFVFSTRLVASVASQSPAVGSECT